MNASHISTSRAAATATAADGRPGVTSASAAARPRLWLPALLVVAYWGLLAYVSMADLAISTAFMSSMGAAALLGLLFLIWWMTNRRVAGSDRLFCVSIAIAGGLVAGILGDQSVGVLGVLLIGVPFAITAWFIWLLVARGRTSRVLRLGLLGVMLVIWSQFLLVRVDGLDGSNRATLAWRWSPSAEDRYLTERSQAQATPASVEGDAAPLALQQGDSPQFRGPNRQGELRGERIATDWGSKPPRKLWGQKIGPAWSSVVVIGERLFTQEQRGPEEVVVCLDAATGRELWAHEDQARWSDGQAGAGPRATPTFADGRIYTLGATGILNCLDAAAGKLHWTRDVARDSGASIPVWGFSSSPLVAQGVVSVHAGGPGDKGLLAYDAATGEPAWSMPSGSISYSSPQLVSFGGEEQVAIFSDQGVAAAEAKHGSPRWEFTAPAMGIWRVVQPRQVGDHSLLIGCEDLSLVRLEVTPGEPAWSVEKRWVSRAMRPAYNDFVISDGHIYGFDESVFTCLDVESGKRLWKAGRYGHGQVLLIADQDLLLVVTETGEVVLVSARPDKHEELGRFQAVVGKTWNHPVVAHRRLYVRNDEEIACFDVTPSDSTAAE